jgi:prevent-host-death family protein
VTTSTIGLTEARERLTEILERVLEGEQMIVTRYGSPVAAIVPVPDDPDDSGRPVGLAAFAGAGAARRDLYGTVAAVVGMRPMSRDREPPEIA